MKRLISSGEDVNMVFQPARFSKDQFMIPLPSTVENIDSIKFSSALAAAAYLNNIKAAALLLKHGADISLHNYLALRLASLTGSVKVLNLILRSKRADFTQNLVLRDALALAAQGNRTDVIKYLLGLDGWLHERGSLGFLSRTTTWVLGRKQLFSMEDKNIALTRASFYGNTQVVQLLLKKRADVNYHQGIPLLAAVRTGNANMVNFLLRNGARKELNDYAAFILAVQGGQVHLLSVLRPPADKKELSKEIIKNALIAAVEKPVTGVISIDELAQNDVVLYSLALEAATKREKELAVRHILQRFDTIGKSGGRTKALVKNAKSAALIEAVATGNGLLVELLLQAMADPTYRNFQSFKNAGQFGFCSLIKLLSSHVQAKEKAVARGYALTEAIRANSSSCVETLLQLPHNMVNIQVERNTALRLAIERNDFELFRTLYERGVDISEKKFELLFIAASNGYVDILKYILDAQGTSIPLPTIMRLVSSAAFNERSSSLIELLKMANAKQLGVSQTVKQQVSDHLGKLLVDLVESKKNPAALIVLKYSKLKVEHLNAALLRAAKNGDTTVGLGLINQGALADVENGSALILAAQYGNLGFIDLLLRQKVDIASQKYLAIRSACIGVPFEERSECNRNVLPFLIATASGENQSNTQQLKLWYTNNIDETSWSSHFKLPLKHFPRMTVSYVNC